MRNKQDKIKVSIIIKALNEEEHIIKCIEKAIAALKEVKGKNEIILVDSGSRDDTVKLAKKYPIKILQLRESWLKTPAAPLQTGYNFSNGEYIYVLDGDMYLEKGSIKKLLPYLEKKDVAGVSGYMTEPKVDNIISTKMQKRLKRIMKAGSVEYLNGGGLYKRRAIEDSGYLSNPFIHAGEEADLGLRLRKKGYKLIRVNLHTITHNFYKMSSMKILKMKWKSGYMLGPGQVLREGLKNKFFFKYIKSTRIIKICLGMISWWVLGLVSVLLLLYGIGEYISLYLLFTLLSVILLAIKKKSIKYPSYSIFSWSIQSLGIILGFIKGAKDYSKYPKDAIMIKE